MPSTYDYVICARNITGKTRKAFGAENAPCSYLAIPAGQDPDPEQCIETKDWIKRVIAESRRGVAADQFGHLLVFIHGYSNPPAKVLQRHRRLQSDLRALGFKGTVVSFDWPSGSRGAFYLEDLKEAHDGAHQLIKEGIVLLAEHQRADCAINVHVLAHSMGAYVTREAFHSADDVDEMTGKSWHVSQIMLIAPDISAKSMCDGDPRSETMYRVANRVTVYSSRHDTVLGLSNVKRAGVAHRLGRVGLPDAAPGRAVNVDCTDYWATIPDQQHRQGTGNPVHSWHIGDPVFTRDMLATMNGVDREVVTTRRMVGPNRFVLQPA